MAKKGRGILVVHSDLSDRVARRIVASISGKGRPITRRNVRYGYFPSMYELVLLIGVEFDKDGGSVISYDYVPYSEYCAKATGTHLSRDAYHVMYADKISEKIVDALAHF